MLKEKKERLLVGGREVRDVTLGNQSERKAKEHVRKRETGGWNFSITAHADNKDPDFKRL